MGVNAAVSAETHEPPEPGKTASARVCGADLAFGHALHDSPPLLVDLGQSNHSMSLVTLITDLGGEVANPTVSAISRSASQIPPTPPAVLPRDCRVDGHRPCSAHRSADGDRGAV